MGPPIYVKDIFLELGVSSLEILFKNSVKIFNWFSFPLFPPKKWKVVCKNETFILCLMN